MLPTTPWPFAILLPLYPRTFPTYLCLIHSYSFLILQVSVLNSNFLGKLSWVPDWKKFSCYIFKYSVFSFLELVTVNHFELIQLYDQHWLNKEYLQRMNIPMLHLIITLLIHILWSTFWGSLLFSKFYTMKTHWGREKLFENKHSLMNELNDSICFLETEALTLSLSKTSQFLKYRLIFRSDL